MVAAPFPAARPPLVPDGLDPDFARSVQLWSRAYPRRWRAARGDELLGLLADLAAPGARRLDARSAVDLVRCGWATRLRERPPLWPWLQYRLFAARSLRDHRGWVADDIAGALFPLRNGGLVPWVVIIVNDLIHRWTEGVSLLGAWWFWVIVAVALVGDWLLGGYERRRAIEKHLLVRPGDRVTAGSWVHARAPRSRVTARTALPWAAVASVCLLAVCVGAGAAGVADGGVVPHGAMLVVLGLAILAGTVLAPAARTRLRRPDSGVDQPDRELVPVGARRATFIVLGVAILAALPIAEALGAVPLGLGLWPGVAAGVLAPPAVAAWLVVRRLPGTGDLALVDVCRIGLVGRAPRVDRPAAVITPAQPSEVGALWPGPRSAEGQTPALG